jgi:fumarylacetoacetate (FAA) hydrolase
VKLASLKTGGRDGTLLVVSGDLETAVVVPQIAPTLQAALENWAKAEPQLALTYQQLNDDQLKEAFSFDQREAHSPLPRAYQWCEASVFISHLERCRKSTNRKLPESLYTEIGMYQGGSDSFVPPTSSMLVETEDWDADLEAGVCVITDDVPRGTTVEDAAKHIKLVVLVNDFSLRALQPHEMSKGLGVLQCKPANSYSPVAVTPASLGSAWNGGMLARPVTVMVRDEIIGEPEAHRDALFNFPQLITHLAMTRDIEAGSIIGAGTVSNKDESRGFACLLEKRAAEILTTGTAVTPFLHYGDRIRIECFDEAGQSIFGAIDQVLAKQGSN